MISNGSYSRHHIGKLVGALALVLLLAEFGARYVMPRVSKIDSRTYREHQAANEMALSSANHKVVLIVGNSLMRTAIDVPMMQRLLKPDLQFDRFIIENTGYLDWYYGLQNLFANGNRPAFVIVMLDPRQLLAASTRGPYSAFWLFSSRGTFEAGIDAGYHPTEISGMLVGHFSAYYGKRLEIRKVAFQKVVPGALALTSMLLPERIATDRIAKIQIQSTGREHLLNLKKMCAQYGVRLIFLVPPLQKRDAVHEALVALTNSLNVGGPILDVQFDEPEKYTSTGWPDKYFDSDHWHFSEQGAAAYTARLGPALSSYMQVASP